MRIGVNALFMIPGEVGGTEIYLRNLLAAFAAEPDDHEYILFTNRETGASLAPPDDARFQSWPQPIAGRFRPGRILWEQLVMSTGDCDILLNPGFTSPYFARCPQLTWLHDLQHKRHPEYFKFADLLAWQFLVWASARRSTELLTLSESSREDIHRFYGVPMDRIHIAAPGVGEVFPAIHAQRNEPIVLCVSTLHPHKGIETFRVSACAGRHERLSHTGHRSQGGRGRRDHRLARPRGLVRPVSPGQSVCVSVYI
ncbi:MAG: glycosyltransferase [Acidobacteria bacterium]|nr:glycosyltransferase [Acidobacteriota bacterium]